MTTTNPAYSTKSNARAAAKKAGLDVDTLVFFQNADDRWTWRAAKKGEPTGPKAGEDDAFKGAEFLDKRKGGTADEIADRAKENVRKNQRGGGTKRAAKATTESGNDPALAEYAASLRAKQQARPTPAEKQAATKSARKAAKAKAPAAATGPKTVRPGSKAAIIAGLLTRKEGCTTADVLEATGWPAVSMPQQARIAGLELTKEKVGKVTRYHGTPIKAAKASGNGANGEAHASA